MLWHIVFQLIAIMIVLIEYQLCLRGISAIYLPSSFWHISGAPVVRGSNPCSPTK